MTNSESGYNNIYAIHCPISGHVVYIGRSIHPEKRLKQHMCCKYNLIGWWCIAMKSIGMIPYLTVLKSGINASGHQANVIEDEFISKYKAIKQANHNRFHSGRNSSTTMFVERPISEIVKDLNSIEIIKIRNSFTTATRIV